MRLIGLSTEELRRFETADRIFDWEQRDQQSWEARFAFDGTEESERRIVALMGLFGFGLAL